MYHFQAIFLLIYPGCIFVYQCVVVSGEVAHPTKKTKYLNYVYLPQYFVRATHKPRDRSKLYF